MKTTCIINTYNYAQFLSEAIESVLRQTVRFDEIIVVDDCSTDETDKVLAQFNGEERLKVIKNNENRGQLSCFNAGFIHSEGDIISFLDADDRYYPEFLRTISDLFAEKPEVDFVSCAAEFFGNTQGYFTPFQASTGFGYSVLKAQFLYDVPMGMTSTFTIRRHILERFLPLSDFESAWKTRADDCLAFGSALVGARRYYLNLALIGYRIHGNNSWYGKNFSADYNYQRDLEIDRLFTRLITPISLSPKRLKAFVLREFESTSDRNRQDLNDYCKIVSQLPISFLLKLRLCYRLSKLHRIMTKKSN
ncbi:MAG TPA: glycosyltransferase family 2 protein [Desulfuromonadales bacterium]|nr:glycosyltransferase family 2 protein [Desulfuromonadales bacterium]